MKVAHLSVLSPPGSAPASGVPKVAATLLKSFETIHGICIDAIARIDNLPNPINETRGSVTYRYAACPPKGKTLTLYLGEVSALRKSIRGVSPDIIHAQPTSDCLLAATSCGLPSVLTIHGLVARESSGAPLWHSGSIANLVRDYMQRVAIARANHIIVCSEYVRDYLKGKTQARLWSIPNPVDEEFFSIRDATWEGIRILCAGIISIRKNQMLILKSCRLLKEMNIPFQCRFIGPFSPGMEKTFRDFVHRNGLQGLVQIMGKVSFEEVEENYSWSNVVALASREETMPLSLMQGMATGRAVFGSARAGIPALLGYGKYGTLFDADDPRQLAGSLAAMSLDPNLVAGKAFAAKKHALANFHPKPIAKKTLEVYSFAKLRKGSKET